MLISLFSNVFRGTQEDLYIRIQGFKKGAMEDR